jgi:hypothetical protein
VKFSGPPHGAKIPFGQKRNKSGHLFGIIQAILNKYLLQKGPNLCYVLLRWIPAPRNPFHNGCGNAQWRAC